MPNSSIDPIGRTTEDRLIWLSKIFLQLEGKISVPKLISIIKEGDYTYLITKKIKGKSLAQILYTTTKDRPFTSLSKDDQRYIIDLLVKTIKAVEELHNLNIVHRDLTPSNILFGKKGIVSLIDLEMSHDILNLAPFPPFVSGTHGYVAPEQLKYAKPEKTEDVYSLGCITIKLLTGEHPGKIIDMKKFSVTQKNLLAICANATLCDLALACIDPNPLNRPSPRDMSEQLILYCKKFL